VLHTVEQLVKRYGFTSTEVPVDKYGVVDPKVVADAIRDDTALITIMLANNEVGTIEPIGEIAALARAKGIPFHTDAVQAGGAMPLDVKGLKVDLLSLSAHKFYGPKGVGLLYARKGVPLWPMQTGGAQEANRRAGTENTAYIVGMAKAMELAYSELEENNKRITALRDRLIAGVLQRIPDVELSGHPKLRLPNSASFLIHYVEGEGMLLNLDMKGIAASTGSACTSASLSPPPAARIASRCRSGIGGGAWGRGASRTPPRHTRQSGSSSCEPRKTSLSVMSHSSSWVGVRRSGCSSIARRS